MVKIESKIKIKKESKQTAQLPTISTNQKEIPIKISVDQNADESMTQEEAFGKIAMILGITKDPMLLTEIDDIEVKQCAALETVADATKNVMLKSVVKNFLKLRVSYKRQGRKELLELSKASRTEPEGRVSRFKQLLGLKS